MTFKLSKEELVGCLFVLFKHKSSTEQKSEKVKRVLKMTQL